MLVHSEYAFVMKASSYTVRMYLGCGMIVLVISIVLTIGLVVKELILPLNTSKIDNKVVITGSASKQSTDAKTTELIRNSLIELPTLITAKIAVKPDYDRTNSELVLKVEVSADEKAYGIFVKRLEETLNKVAIREETVVLEASNQKYQNSMGQETDGPDEYFVVEDANSLGGPRIPKTKQDLKSWVIWVCSSTSANKKTQTWNGYLLPGDPTVCFTPLLMPEVSRYGESSREFISTDTVTAIPTIRVNTSKTILRLVLQDKNGSTIAQNLRELTVESHNSDRPKSNSNNRRPLLRAGVLQGFRGGVGFAYDSPQAFVILGSKRFNGLIAPFFFQPSHNGSKSTLLCSTKRIVEFRIKLTEEEIKRFDVANVDIVFSN